VLYECPTGYVLRECAWVYDVIGAVDRVEACSPREWMSLPRWFQHASRLVGAERQRIREAEDRQRKDARHD
jgi:hypothetical protein